VSGTPPSEDYRLSTEISLKNKIHVVYEKHANR